MKLRSALSGLLSGSKTSQPDSDQAGGAERGGGEEFAAVDLELCHGHALRSVAGPSGRRVGAVPAGDDRAQLVDRPGGEDHQDVDDEEADQQQPSMTKWMVRAVWRPPSMSARNGSAAFIAGDIASPVRIISGKRTNSTPP